MDHEPMIRVWRYEDAPQSYQDLSTNGGDEDWLAFVPAPLSGEYIPWLQGGTPFGCCCVDGYPVAGGIVYIGSHA